MSGLLLPLPLWVLARGVVAKHLDEDTHEHHQAHHHQQHCPPVFLLTQSISVRGGEFGAQNKSTGFQEPNQVQSSVVIMVVADQPPAYISGEYGEESTKNVFIIIINGIDHFNTHT